VGADAIEVGTGDLTLLRQIGRLPPGVRPVDGPDAGELRVFRGGQEDHLHPVFDRTRQGNLGGPREPGRHRSMDGG
jgi:hypothetical protein